MSKQNKSNKKADNKVKNKSFLSKNKIKYDERIKKQEPKKSSEKKFNINTSEAKQKTSEVFNNIYDNEKFSIKKSIAATNKFLHSKTFDTLLLTVSKSYIVYITVIMLLNVYAIMTNFSVITFDISIFLLLMYDLSLIALAILSLVKFRSWQVTLFTILWIQLIY